jgi:L-lactate dehydrogenase (cytochrome)/(S)-mandelate dehydrogenase
MPDTHVRIDRAVNLEDIRQMARRRLPRIAFDFIDGGVEGERCLERNRAVFDHHHLVPRYLVNVGKRSQAVTLFGHTYASPFGIGPAGLAGLFRPETDRMLAEEAARANIPFAMSAASALSIEDAARIGPETTWFQAYGTNDPDIVDDQVRRAAASGIRTLLLTVDVPIVPRRERNIRNGFSRPLKMNLARIMEGLGHPSWLWGYLRSGGVPLLVNWVKYAAENADKEQVADLFGANTPASGQEWPTVDRLRRIWPHKLVVKGLLHPADARRAADAGVDGIVVSNHGGRQLDAAPTPLLMLPFVRQAVGDGVTLMIDSGLRRGSDILVTRCLGAEFALFARPTLYGSAAAGAKGIRKVIEIVRTEIDLTLGQIGCPDIGMLTAECLAANVGAIHASSPRP